MPQRNGNSPVVDPRQGALELSCEHETTLMAVLDHSTDGIFIVAVDPTASGAPHSQGCPPLIPQEQKWGGNLLVEDPTQETNFRFVAANPACRKMLLFRTGEVRGLRLDECLPEAIALSTVRHLQRCFQMRRSIFTLASFDVCADVAGNVFTCSQTIRIRLSPVLALDGTITKIIGLCQDLTEQQRVEAEAQLLQTITQAIAGADDFHAALSLALRYCCEATGWDYGEAWIPTPSGLESSLAWYSSNNHLITFRKTSQGLTFPLGIGLPGRVWLRKQPEWHRDVSQEPDKIFLRAGLAQDFGLRAGLGVPIMANDQVLAVLVFLMFESRDTDRRLVEIVSAVAAQLGSLMQRKQAEAALRESERRLAHLIDSLPGMVYSSTNDPEWSMTYLSEGVFPLTGYKSEELAGNNRVLSYSALTHPEDLPKILSAIKGAIAHKQPYVAEYRIRTKFGEEKWVWEKGSGVFDSSGKIKGLEGFITDITELKQAEEVLKHRVDFEKLIATISTQFINLPPNEIDSGINQALETIGTFSDVDCSYIFLFSDNGTRMDNTHEWCRPGIEPQIHNLKNLCVDDFPWIMDKIKRFETIHIPSVAELPASARAEKVEFQSQGILSMLNVPIVYRETLVGFFGFDSVRSLKTWSEGTIALLKILGEIFVNALERKRTEEELLSAEEKYHSIFENAVEGIFQTTPEGHYLTANPMLAQIYGYDSPTQLMSCLTDIQHQLYVNPNRRTEFRRLLHEQDAVWGFEAEIYRKDGSAIWISENARAIRDANGQLLRYEGTVVDITQRKQAEAELHKRDNLLSGVAEAMNHLLTEANHGYAVSKALTTLGIAAGVDQVYICENNSHPVTGEIVSCLRFEWTRENSESAEYDTDFELPPETITTRVADSRFRWFGYTDEIEKSGVNAQHSTFNNSPFTLDTSHFTLHASGAIALNLLQSTYDTLSVGQSVSALTRDLEGVERQMLSQKGTLSILIVPILVNNQFWGYIGFEDFHRERQWSKGEEAILMAIAASIGGALQRHRTEESIRHQAFHDRLTGLPNRQQLDERLPLAIDTARRRGNKLAVMFLDLDRFKIINDTLGHAVGDKLLQSATQRLKSCLREGDTIVRWGGDEFILLLPDISEPKDAAQIAQRILEAVRPAFDIEDRHLYITSSIGIALYPNDGEDAETLIQNADTALYVAKEQGRNNYQTYTRAMHSGASELFVLDNSLHQALERLEFLVYYQPQVNTETGNIVSMEALVRWEHPELGLVLPQTFLSLAEENGLIVPLGKWVLRTACAQNKAWAIAGLPPVRVSVNLSARQFHQPDLAEMVSQVLDETGLDSHLLELEITETTAMHDPSFTKNMLTRLRSMGVCISMDDFGIGYASLSSLKNFPFQTLKIDRAFIAEVATNPHDTAIVKAAIALGHGLNLNVVAEGVETEAQRDCLRTLLCYDMQGFLFSPPLCATDATTLLQQQFVVNW